jgi:hypothetical protein
MQNDGIHPTPEGQAAMLDNVWPELEPLLAGTARLPSSSGGAIPQQRQH